MYNMYNILILPISDLLKIHVLIADKFAIFPLWDVQSYLNKCYDYIILLMD